MRGICWGKTIHSANDKLADIKLAYHLIGVKPKAEKKERNKRKRLVAPSLFCYLLIRLNTKSYPSFP